MREVASWIEGSLTLSESTVVQHGGTIEHDLTVSANTHLDLHGAVEGDLIVEPGGIAKVHGTVLGADQGRSADCGRGARLCPWRAAGVAGRHQHGSAEPS